MTHIPEDEEIICNVIAIPAVLNALFADRTRDKQRSKLIVASTCMYEITT